VAAHGGRGGINDCTRPGEWECEKWSRDNSYDIGLVRIRPVSGGDTGLAGHDFEYFVVGSLDGRGMTSSPTLPNFHGTNKTTGLSPTIHKPTTDKRRILHHIRD
jgi:hypothetical protein